MTKLLKTVALLLVVVIALASGASGVSYAQEPEDSGTTSYVLLSEDEMSRYEADAYEVGVDSLLRAWCNYETKGDYPHRSSTGFAVSAHGWWLDRSPGECPEYADVRVTLQARVCEHYGTHTEICSWDTLGEPAVERIRAGGGSGKRTTARHDCASDQAVSYRSIIDVDLVGIWDGPGRLYAHKNVDCYPAS